MRNKIPFTPVQTQAIRSGMNPGLTMVVGPPGTGARGRVMVLVLGLECRHKHAVVFVPHCG